MTPRTEFLDARRQGLGGSDIASLFGIGYGCRLRLWRDKRNQPVDYEAELPEFVELGAYLESFIADKYQRVTGRTVETRDRLTHPEYPELAVNVDRIINPESASPGVLEIKAVGREVFYNVKRNGLPDDYILQLQHGMLVTGYTWGAFAVMNRDNAALLHWDVQRDQKICDLILRQGPLFWALVQNGPAPEMLDPNDKRCHSCEYRRSCQGAALAPLDDSGDMPQAPDLAELLTEYERLDALYSCKLADNSRGTETDAQMEAVRSEIKAVLGERQAVMVGADKVYFRPQAGRETLDPAIVVTYEKIRMSLRSRAEDVEAFDKAFPAASTFQKRGNPFKVLRIYAGKK